MERFSENFDQKAVTYLIFFVGTHWFQKCKFWKKNPEVAEVKQPRNPNKNSKWKLIKIDEIQNLASATLKMATSPQGTWKGLSEFLQKIHFLKLGHWEKWVIARLSG